MRQRRYCGVLWLAVLALTACGGTTPASEATPDVDVRGSDGGFEDVAIVFPELPTDPDGLSDALEVPDTPDSTDVGPDIPWTPSPCQAHSDCDDGFCVEIVAGSGEFFCAPTCIEECPGDWLCKAIHLDGPDLVSICLPGDGCHGAADGTPCNGPDPCKAYACHEGFCVGEAIELDLTPDGHDDDCDGKVDEDVYVGFRLLGGRFSAGPGTLVGGGWTLSGAVSTTGYTHPSSGEGFVLTPGGFASGPGGAL